MTSLSSAEACGEIARLSAIAADFRRRMEADPGSLYPAHAETLLQLGALLANQGEKENALEAVAESVLLFRALAGAQPAAFRLHLASALNSLSGRFSEAGMAEEARATSVESVEIANLALADQPDQARYVLVAGLINQAGLSMRNDDAETTIAVLGEAVRTFCDGGEAGAPYMAPMIEALHRAAMGFAETDKWEEAITLRRMMVSLFAAEPPSAILHLLGLALQQGSAAMGKARRHAEAAALGEEAVALGRTLCAADAAVYGVFLAQTLGNLAGRRHDMGENHAGLELALEAVNLFHTSMGEEPGTAVPALVVTLRNLTNILSALGLTEQAATVNEQRAQLQATLELQVSKV
ncbi:conserved hypothetical protein [Candidatus Terasakiella magnetica]|nr:conserved hypothetical protein [Candidatus Terasakiella magnetica]